MLARFRRSILILTLVTFIVPGLVGTVVGESLSHGFVAAHGADHSHHGGADEGEDDVPQAMQHDAGNHFHETAAHSNDAVVVACRATHAMRLPAAGLQPRWLVYPVERPPRMRVTA